MATFGSAFTAEDSALVPPSPEPSAGASEASTPESAIVSTGAVDDLGFDEEAGNYVPKKWAAPGECRIIIDRHGGYDNCYGWYGVDQKDEPKVPSKSNKVADPSADVCVAGINRFKTSKSVKHMGNIFQLGNDYHFELWYDGLQRAYPVRAPPRITAPHRDPEQFAA